LSDLEADQEAAAQGGGLGQAADCQCHRGVAAVRFHEQTGAHDRIRRRGRLAHGRWQLRTQAFARHAEHVLCGFTLCRLEEHADPTLHVDDLAALAHEHRGWHEARQKHALRRAGDAVHAALPVACSRVRLATERRWAVVEEVGERL